jgi:hypothetical protein
MIVARDHYFASWVITKGVPYIIEDGKIKLDLDSVQYSKYLSQYRNTDKPLLEKVRSVIRELNLSRTSYGSN